MAVSLYCQTTHQSHIFPHNTYEFYHYFEVSNIKACNFHLDLILIKPNTLLIEIVSLILSDYCTLDLPSSSNQYVIFFRIAQFLFLPRNVLCSPPRRRDLLQQSEDDYV